MKVFFDTNVLFAAFATRGLCADLVSLVLRDHELVIGEVVLGELREKLRVKLKAPKKTIDEIDALLREGTVVPRPKKHLSLRITDPDDEWVVASAFAGSADVFVTGDAAVLKVAKRSPMPIVTPRGLWEMLRTPRPSAI